jgi:hypothetical protein
MPHPPFDDTGEHGGRGCQYATLCLSRVIEAELLYYSRTAERILGRLMLFDLLFGLCVSN